MTKNARARYLIENTKLLKEMGYSFESKNNGYHLIVENRFDFWPSTDKWQERVGQYMPITGPHKGRGLIALSQVLNQSNIEPKIPPHLCQCKTCDKFFQEIRKI